MTPADDSLVLSARNLTVSFDAGAVSARSPAVRGVDFDIYRGQILALVGESGSGKSVTALSILGLLPPSAQTSGSIRLCGEETIGASYDALRKIRATQIGIVFQEPMSAFNPVLTIGAQLAEAINVGARRQREATRDRSFTLLDAVGLHEPERLMRSFPHQLSGGQLQRAMIAMATAREPQLLIADEPTTALDVTVQAGILDLIRALRDDQDLAVLLITHDIGVVADLANDVLVMRNGAVVEAASSLDLFARPKDEYTRSLLASVPRLDQAPSTEAIQDRSPAHRDHELSAQTTETPVAQLDAVSIGYRSARLFHKPDLVVSDLSISIAPGEVCGLVGESGSGKSTVGKALVGLLPVAAGRVSIEGRELSSVSGAQLRRLRSRIGYIFQDPASSLNPRSTIADNIAEPLRVHTAMDETARRDRIRELLDAVRLPRDVTERFAHELSGGQRQRVAIARALTLNPSLLIADEPTSALDVSVQASVLDLIRSLQRDFGFSCLFISHDLAVVRGLADRVAVMRGGRLMEQGPVMQVFERPTSEYTQRLLAAVLTADPVIQNERRRVWQAKFSTRALQVPALARRETQRSTAS